jgi:hypothetical protein
VLLFVPQERESLIVVLLFATTVQDWLSIAAAARYITKQKILEDAFHWV